MSLTLYYAPMSTASVTRLVLEELAVPFEIVTVDLRKGESRSPHFLELNPNGKVPVLVHDDVALWESAAISLYLGETFGVERQVYPPPGPLRGEATKWIVWANVTLGKRSVAMPEIPSTGSPPTNATRRPANPDCAICGPASQSSMQP
jgi:glutathione S-transferase